MLYIVIVIAKLSQAPATAGLSLALFPNYPATRPGRPGQPDPTGIVFLSNISTCNECFSVTIKLSQAQAQLE